VNVKRDRFAGKTVKGSARISLDLAEPRFHKLRFIDRSQSHIDALSELVSEYPAQWASVHCGDANLLIPEMCEDLLRTSSRAFVFIDPFATEVRWTTVEALAHSKATDVLLMFPAGAVRQMLPREGMPPESWQPRLDSLFRGRYWAGAYTETTHPGFWEEVRRLHTDEGFESIVSCYRDRLVSVFTESGVVPLGFPLLRRKHKPGTQLFELMFASANPRGQALATRIAGEIMRKAQREGDRLLDGAEDLVLGVWDDSAALPNTVGGQFTLDLP
jgi:three-Cys-motif partner protein